MLSLSHVVCSMPALSLVKRGSIRMRYASPFFGLMETHVALVHQTSRLFCA
jgi:hypothetical protein